MPKPVRKPGTLPTTREGRKRLIQKSTDEYINRMGPLEIEKLLTALSRTKGLTEDERKEDDRFNVAREFLPDYMRFDH